MPIELNIVTDQGVRPWKFDFERMVNAGYVGRNQEEVRRHIEELAAKGIPGPKKIPTLYPVIARALITDDVIEVYGEQTSGEVEYVLFIVGDEEIYVGLGSDHTDRRLEATDIPRAKQICPNLVSRNVWPLSEVEARWDDLVIRSWAVTGGEKVAYQDGRLGLIMAPRELMDFVRSRVGSLDSMVIFSGTLGTLTGGFVHGQRFVAELVDPAVNRRLELEYEVRPLDYMDVDD